MYEMDMVMFGDVEFPVIIPQIITDSQKAIEQKAKKGNKKSSSP